MWFSLSPVLVLVLFSLLIIVDGFGHPLFSTREVIAFIAHIYIYIYIYIYIFVIFLMNNIDGGFERGVDGRGGRRRKNIWLMTWK